MEDKVFLALVVAVSIAFAVVVAPFAGAILWAVIATIVFFPMRNRLLRAMPGQRNRTALLTLLAIIALVIAPSIFLGSILVQEVTAIYNGIRSGQIDLDLYFDQVMHQIPAWANGYVAPLGLTTIDALFARIGGALASSFELIAGRLLNIGQGALSFVLGLGVMLYLTFFLLRDADTLLVRIRAAVPLRADLLKELLDTLTSVIRATIKGSLVVAVLQGSIGGLTYWALGINAPLLWGVVMTILAFLPVVGTALIWAPTALYLFATGAIWQGAVLVGVGVFIIGLVDNIVRPVLVGRETRLPDYIVLIATLGGLAAFGANGLIIGPLIAALFLAVWEIFSQAQAGTLPSDIGATRADF